jgi:hypothetical protein
MPEGACTVFPPGAGSGIALRGAGDGAAGVAGANPLPEEPGAIVAGFGDWALACDGGRAARAQANRAARIMDRSTFHPCLSNCMLAAPSLRESTSAVASTSGSLATWPARIGSPCAGPWRRGRLSVRKYSA